MKTSIKKQYRKTQKVEKPLLITEEKPNDKIIDKAVNRILTFVELEQIYMFHQTISGETTTYYLLLIGMNIGNDNLKSIKQSLESSFGDQCKFLLISHNRYWIQKNLYQYQNFFVFIMQAKHLAYTSDVYHPEPHWEIPHTPQYSDLYFHYKITLESSFQFYKLINGERENYQGISNLFSLFFLSFCRTYIYVKTYYLPNYLTSASLWQLCLYADKEMYKYNHLFEQFFTDIFPFIDYNMRVHHRLSRIEKEDAARMKTIVEELMKELNKLVVDDCLLNDSEIKFLGEIE